MKNYFLPLIISLFLFISCNNEAIEENSSTTEFLTDEDYFETIEQIGLYMISLSEDEKIDQEVRTKFRNLADIVLSDLEKNRILSLPQQKSTIACAALCSQAYRVCSSWARSWDELLRRCNGPAANRPFNCDQIREDYIKNIDKIEAEYLKCINKQNECIKKNCKGPGPIEGL